MPQKRRKENRAINRIRKRRAELELLLNSTKDREQNVDSNTDTKRAKGTTAEGEDNGDCLPSVASVSSISDISHTTKAVKICADDAISEKEHTGIKSAKGMTTNLEDEGSVPPTTSVSTISDISRTTASVIKISSGDEAAHKARELGKELRKQRPKVVAFESKLQLHKLNGKTLSERELAAFLHRHMLGSLNTPNRAGANWLRFEGGRKPLQIVLIRVNCDSPEMLRTHESAKFIDEYFGFKWVRLHHSVRDRHRFWHTISTTTHSLRELLIRKIKEFGDPLLSMRVSERKAQLLTSLADMTLARYPFPTSVFDEKTQNPKIRPTRSTYRRVSESSPIFVIDCEMCLTTEQRLELTRISVINEAGEMLMDELVKPYNKIVDYITFKSGITEKMLSKVNTRLKDIQKRFCALLTDDAILCGHSLENDLLALQLSHPFCIDTSLLFNFSGRAFLRSGLKALADIFLDEKIQNSRLGHCSLQDAQATLKLLKLKLEKGLVFGNVALGWNFSKWASENGMTVHGTRLEKKEQTIETKEEQNRNLLDMTTDEEQMPTENAVDEQMQSGAVPPAELAVAGEEKQQKETENSEKQRTEETQGEESDGTTEKAATEAAIFDFNEAVRIDNAMQQTSTLSDCFKTAHGARKGKKMLVVGGKMDQFFNANGSCVLKDVDGVGRSISSQCADLAPTLMEYEVALVDLHCPMGTDKRELDDAFRHLTAGMCNNSFCLLLLVGLGSKEDDRPILYQRVHQRPMDKAENGTISEEGTV